MYYWKAVTGSRRTEAGEQEHGKEYVAQKHFVNHVRSARNCLYVSALQSVCDCPGNKESVGKRKSGRTRKSNRWVRRLLCEMANAVRRIRSIFQSKYQGDVIRRGHKRTDYCAFGHQLLKTVISPLIRKEPYRDSTVD